MFFFFLIFWQKKGESEKIVFWVVCYLWYEKKVLSLWRKMVEFLI